MNRSRRRATVICWAIAAGVLYGGLAPARAEPTQADAAGTAGRSVVSAAEDAAGPRRPSHRAPAGTRSGRFPPGSRPGRQPADPPAPTPDGTHDHEWECRWWPVIVTPPSAEDDRRGWLGIPIAAVVPVTVPVRSDLPRDLALPSRAVPIPSVPGDLPAPPAVAATGPTSPQAAPLRPGPRYRGSGTPPAATLSVPPLRVPAGPLRMRADLSATPPASVRPGYPEYLRRADVGEMASVALPGLAAIAGMTALGGFFGYRQARAAYLLRAAGAGRFLR